MTENLQAPLYLVPLPIGNDSPKHFHTPYLLETLPEIKFWVAENARTLRRYLSSLKLDIIIDQLEIFESNNHTAVSELEAFLAKIKPNIPLGVASEAGIPCIADPGNRVVTWAHRKNRTVLPLLGPNSISMALESSGMNGQQFVFHGYPPIDPVEQKKWFLSLFLGPWKSYSHAFIETPYRSDKLFGILTNILPDYIHLCIAANLHNPDQLIATKTILEWKKNPITLGKAPVVWVLSAEST